MKQDMADLLFTYYFTLKPLDWLTFLFLICYVPSFWVFENKKMSCLRAVEYDGVVMSCLRAVK